MAEVRANRLEFGYESVADVSIPYIRFSTMVWNFQINNWLVGITTGESTGLVFSYGGKIIRDREAVLKELNREELKE